MQAGLTGPPHNRRQGQGARCGKGNGMGNPLFDYWYFHLPNFVLAALFWTLLGRFALGLFVPENWDNYIWRAFVRLTQPVVSVVRAITPAIVGPRLLLLLAAVWVFVLRLAFYAVLAARGLVPTLQGAGA